VARTEPVGRPTSPPSPLSFRTSGFPQYGCKAGSSGAYPRACSGQACSRHTRPTPRFASTRRALGANAEPSHCVEERRSSRTAVRAIPRATPGALAPVRVMLSQTLIAYSAPSAPLASTARLRRSTTSTRGPASAGAPRPPTSGSVLSLPIPSRHVALIDPGESAGCTRPVPSPATLAFACWRKTRHSQVTHHPLQVGLLFRGCPGLHRYDLSARSPPWTDPTGLTPGRRRLVRPSFHRVGHPSRCRV